MWWEPITATVGTQGAGVVVGSGVSHGGARPINRRTAVIGLWSPS